MADLGHLGQHLVPADTIAKLYDLEMMMESKKSQLVRIEQDIKDITNIALKAKERDRHMLGRDIDECKKKIALLQQHKVNSSDDDIIDV